MKKVLQITLWVILLIVDYAVSAIFLAADDFLGSYLISFWAIVNIIVAFFLIMKKARKLMKIAALPIAAICSLIAYMSIKDHDYCYMLWDLGHGYDYNTYMINSFISMSVLYSLIAWVIFILCYKVYFKIRKQNANE